jgi:ATP-dependent Clp protease ATP-binding subunit ClpB
MIAVDMEKITIKVQQSLNEAQLIAVKYNHQQIEVIHLFMALISQEDGLILYFCRMSLLNHIKQSTHSELDKMPKVLGEGARSSGVYAVRRIEEVFIEGENHAKRFKDSYISVEHVMLAIMDIDSKGIVGKILKTFNITKDGFLNILSTIRGNQRVETQDPEGTYDALKKYGRNLVEEAQKHKLDPVKGEMKNKGW